MTRRALTRNTAHYAANASASLPAVIYTRISSDKEGSERGVTLNTKTAWH